MDTEKTQIAKKKSWERKTELEESGFLAPDKAMVIKRVWYWHKII